MIFITTSMSMMLIWSTSGRRVKGKEQVGDVAGTRGVLQPRNEASEAAAEITFEVECVCRLGPCKTSETGNTTVRALYQEDPPRCCKLIDRTKEPYLSRIVRKATTTFHPAKLDDCTHHALEKYQNWKAHVKGYEGWIERGWKQTTDQDCRGALTVFEDEIESFAMKQDWNDSPILGMDVKWWKEEMVFGILREGRDNSYGKLFTVRKDFLEDRRTCPRALWAGEHAKDFAQNILGAVVLTSSANGVMPITEILGKSQLHKKCSKKDVALMWKVNSVGYVMKAEKDCPTSPMVIVFNKDLATGDAEKSVLWQYELKALAENPPVGGITVYNLSPNSCDEVMMKLRDYFESMDRVTRNEISSMTIFSCADASPGHAPPKPSFYRAPFQETCPLPFIAVGRSIQCAWTKELHHALENDRDVSRLLTAHRWSGASELNVNLNSFEYDTSHGPSNVIKRIARDFGMVKGLFELNLNLTESSIRGSDLINLIEELPQTLIGLTLDLSSTAVGEDISTQLLTVLAKRQKKLQNLYLLLDQTVDVESCQRLKSRSISGDLSRIRIHISCDDEVQCGKTRLEKAVGHLIQQKAANTLGVLKEQLLASNIKAVQSGNPFEVCGIESPEVSIDDLAVAIPMFCDLGKLRRNGHFLASADGSILAKRILVLESRTLENDMFHASDVYPGGCEAFAKTRLTPIITTFRIKDQAYVVMPNVTHYYAHADPENWEVLAVYDAKPLPNLGEGLVKLVKGRKNEWGKEIRNMSEWNTWDEVRDQLSKDLTFLQDRVVDFSLFVHVIQRKEFSASASVPKEFSVGKGCVMDPSKHIIVCFRILDYLTSYTYKREVESLYRAGKFEDYAEKFLHAFDCIGDVWGNSCANYQALATITAAMEVSKAMAKAVIIGVEAFPVAYACTYEEPQLEHKRGGDMDTLTRYAYINKEPRPEYVSFNPHRSHKDIARWLQKAASIESGTSYIRDFCDCNGDNCTDNKCVEDILEYEQHANMDELTKYKDYTDPKRCAKTINEFSTESYWNTGDEIAEMHNVLWNPDVGAMIAVRGLPNMGYSHRDALLRGRQGNCFTKMSYLKCTPDEGGVYFNYNQHFGTLEVMMLWPRLHGRDNRRVGPKLEVK